MGYIPTNNEKILVTPRQALSDEEIQIRLEGFRAGTQIKFLAEMTDDLQTVWESYAIFLADSNGEVDLATQKPEEGTYDEVDGMGLFWSMVPQGVKDLKVFSRKEYSFFIKKELGIPSIISFKVFVDNEEITSNYLERFYMKPGVTVLPVREQDIVGTYYLPRGGEFNSAMLLIGGLDGPQLDAEAALLASRGLAVLALKYFGKEKELPDYVGYIPIEYFKKAIDWLKKKTNKERVGLYGRSKGAEVALMVSSYYPSDVSLIISSMPSSVVLFGIKSMNSLPFPPAWTYKGKALPHLHMKVTWRDWLDLKIKNVAGKKFTFADYYLKAIHENEDSYKKAVIYVEKIQCPIFIISATDDNIWPTTFYCEQIVNRLKKHDFKYPYEYLKCEGAGHYVSNPHWPAGLSDYWKVPGYNLTGISGGSAKYNARAARVFWDQALNFIKKHL